MKLFFPPVAAFILLLASTLPASAQDKGPWRASTSDAKSITGDIGIGDSRLTINFSGFDIAEIRALKQAEASAAFDADPGIPGGGNLYRLNIPAQKKFVRNNTLCGSDDTQWMATWAAGSELHVAFFSGPKMPIFTIDALANSATLCGTYSYAR